MSFTPDTIQQASIKALIDTFLTAIREGNGGLNLIDLNNMLAIAWPESNFRPRDAVSQNRDSTATGLLQVTDSTALDNWVMAWNKSPDKTKALNGFRITVGTINNPNTGKLENIYEPELRLKSGDIIYDKVITSEMVNGVKQSVTRYYKITIIDDKLYELSKLSEWSKVVTTASGGSEAARLQKLLDGDYFKVANFVVEQMDGPGEDANAIRTVDKFSIGDRATKDLAIIMRNQWGDNRVDRPDSPNYDATVANQMNIQLAIVTYLLAKNSIADKDLAKIYHYYYDGKITPVVGDKATNLSYGVSHLADFWDNYLTNLHGAEIDSKQSRILANLISGEIEHSAFGSVAAKSRAGLVDNVYQALDTGGTLAGTFKKDIIIGIGGNDVLFGEGDSDYLYGGGGSDYLHGDFVPTEHSTPDMLLREINLAGNDHLYGGSGTDYLFGGYGDDYLDGGEDDDFLYGGHGNDIYVLNTTCPGTDTIEDSDGSGKLIIQLGDTGDTFSPIKLYLDKSRANTYTIEGQPFFVATFTPDSPNSLIGTLRIIYNNFHVLAAINGFDKSKSSYLGMTLIDAAPGGQASADSTINLQAAAEAAIIDKYGSLNVNRNNIYIGGHRTGVTSTMSINGISPMSMSLFGLTSQDVENVDLETVGGIRENTIIGDDRAEIIRGNGHNDYLVGGKGNDYIYGGAGHDYIVGGLSPINSQGEASSSSSGFEGNGIYQDDDYLVGGDGRDMIIGGLGDDTIIASETAGEEGHTTDDGDWVAGGQGNDVIFGSRDRDILMGGSGRDFIEGNGGDDTIFGDGDEYQVAYYGDRFAIEFRKVMYKDNEGLLWKTSIGADGTLHTTEVTDEYKINPQTGQPVIDPETGEKVVEKEGFILVYSPRGWSVIVSDEGDLTEFRRVNNADGGGSRIDEKALADSTPGAHNDYLYGGLGNDMILGQVGNDILDGGEGNDILFGDEDHITEKPIYADGTSAEGDDELYGGQGSDHLYGGGGDDILYADASYNDADRRAASDNETDYLYGGEGDDTLYSGSGDDELYGGEGDDRLYGGTDHTILSGEAGNDYLEAGQVESGPGNFLHGGEGDDVLVSNLGQHQLQGGAGHDAYKYSSQLLRQDREGINDLILDEDGDWSLVLDGRTISSADLMNIADTPYWVARDGSFFFEADGEDLWFSLCDAEGQAIGKPVLIKNGISQADFLQGEMLVANDEGIWGTSGHDIINAPAEGGIIFGLAGDDTLIGSEGPDALYGGEDNDSIFGGGGKDALYGDEGDDVIYGDAGNDYLEGGSGDDYLDGGEGDDYIIAGEGHDRIYGGAGNDIIDGVSGDNIIYGGDGDDQIQAGYGNNQVYGGDGDDIIYSPTIGGQAGLDPRYTTIIDGGAGNDVYMSHTAIQSAAYRYEAMHSSVYLFGQGSGHDKMVIKKTNGTIINSNIVQLQDLNAADVDIYLDYSRTIYFCSVWGFVYNLVIRIKSTGETLTVQEPYVAHSPDLQKSDNYPHETINNRPLIKFADGTTMDWDAIGFKYDQGDGNVFLLQDTKPWTSLYLPNLSRDEVVFSEDGRDLLMTVKATGCVLKIGGPMGYWDKNHGIETIIFGGGQGTNDGPVTFAAAVTLPGPLSFSMPLQRLLDEAQGTFGDSGDGLVNGNPKGGFISGSTAPEKIVGGKGDDIINGGLGSDWQYGSDGNDVLVSSNTLIDADNGIYAQGWDFLFGGAGDDVIRGGPSYGGNCRVIGHGGAGNDTFIIDQNDYMCIDLAGDSSPTSTEVDVLRFMNGSLEDIIASGIGLSTGMQWGYYPEPEVRYPGTSLELGSSATGHALVYFGDREWSSLQLHFADGTEINCLDLINQIGFTNIIYGSSPNDPIEGSEYDDTIRIFSNEPDERGLGAKIHGYGGDDHLYGGGQDDHLLGGDGHDLLAGNYGHDVLDGGSGNDVYFFNAGDGRDIIHNNDIQTGRRDVIRFGEDIFQEHLILSRQKSADGGYDDLVIDFYGNPVDRITVKNFFAPDGAWAINAFEFSGGAIWDYEAIIAKMAENSSDQTSAEIIGTTGDDSLSGGDDHEIISGGDGDDILTGGRGNDILAGGPGSDIYVYNLGDGHDEIYLEAGDVLVDVLLLGPGIRENEVRIERGKSADGFFNDLVLTFKQGPRDRLIVHDYFNQAGSARLAAIKFADGINWSLNDVLDLLAINYQVASEAGHALIGTDGNDLLLGSDGADVLASGKGEDILDGGAGNDQLQVTGSGLKTFIFGRGYGHDTVDASSNSHHYFNGNQVDVKLIGLTLDDVEFITRATTNHNSNSGLPAKHHLIIRIKDTGETLTIIDAFEQPVSAYRADFSDGTWRNLIEFSDGTKLTWPDIFSLPNYMAGEAVNSSNTYWATFYGGAVYGDERDNYLYGSMSSDALYGGGGDDYLNGGDFNRKPHIHDGYGVGCSYADKLDDDYLHGGAGNDIFECGSGHDVINAFDANESKSDTIVLNLFAVSSMEHFRNTAVYNESTGKYDWILINRETGETIRVLSAISAPGDTGFNPYSIQAVIFDTWQTYYWNDLYDSSWINGLAGGGKVLFSGAEGGSLVGTSADDEIYGGRGDNYLQGGGGNDFILTGLGHNRVDGGSGNDTIDGSHGTNTIVFGRGSGHDRVIRGQDNYDSLTVDMSTLRKDEVTFSLGMTNQNPWASHTTALDRSKSLVITIKSTGETLTFTPFVVGWVSLEAWIKEGLSCTPLAGIDFADGFMSWPDICDAHGWMAHFTGTDDGDLMSFGYENRMTMQGLGGDDRIYGGHKDDLLYGDGGDDELYGDKGDDMIYGGTGHDILLGQDGDDHLEGGTGDDLLTGGVGNDCLEGGTGNDTYIYHYRDGRDIINNYDTGVGRLDILRFGDHIIPSDVTFSRGAGYDLIINFPNNTSDQITVLNFFQPGGAYALDRLEFFTGHVITREIINNMFGLADDAKTRIFGGSGDDLLEGGSGDDEIMGDAGRDTIRGGDGNDLIKGGSGDDFLEGGAGSDIYVFNSGDGRDTINNNDEGKECDAVLFGSGIDRDDLIVERVINQNGRYDDLTIRFKNNPDDQITILNFFVSESDWTVDYFQFSDGGLWDKDDILRLIDNSDHDDIVTGTDGNDRLLGLDGNDCLSGGRGNDYLEGGSGVDIYCFNRGDGQDTINNYDPGSNPDIIKFGPGLRAWDIVFTRTPNEDGPGDHLVISFINNPGDSVTVLNYFSPDGKWLVNRLEFADGKIVQLPGPGRETIIGIGSQDAFAFGRGFGNISFQTFGPKNARRESIQLVGLSLDEVEFLALPSNSEHTSYYDLVIRIKDTGETATVINAIHGLWAVNTYNIQAIEFNDGRTMEWGELTSSGLISMNGTAGSDIIHINNTGLAFPVYGHSGDDYLYGHSGNDILHGGAGDDRLEGGDGNDCLEGGDGNDSLYAGNGDDILDGGSGDDNLYGNAGDDILSGETGNDYLDGGEGSDVIYGGAGDDQLFGGTDHDLLDGGSGHDYLEGGTGNDVYVFGRGYGQDTVNALDSTVGKRDVVRLDGLSLDEVEFLVVQNGSTYYHLIIRIKEAGETLTIQNAIHSNASSKNNYSIEAIEFGDGTVMEWAELEQAGLIKMVGTDDNDTLISSRLGTRMEGGVGHDTLNGGAGHDAIYGGQGNDILKGNAGNDILDGGSGDDSLEGGAGDDIYVFGRGYGHDTMSAYDGTVGKRDVVRLLGLTLEDVEFLTQQNGTSNHDLVIRIKETGETLTVQKAIYSNAASRNYSSIEAIEFGDGTVMEWAELEQAGLLKMVGTDGNDTLTSSRLGAIMDGGSGDDTLNGGLGNDAIYGGAGHDSLKGGSGNDILDGGAGDDTLEGGVGDDIYVFGRGYGHDLVKANDSTVGKRDLVRLLGLGLDDVEILSGPASGNYHNLMIVIKATGETLTIEKGYAPSLAANTYGIQALELGDGTVIEWDDLVDGGLIKSTVQNGGTGDDRLTGTIGDDTLTGLGGHDILDGRAGNDTLNGGAGNDIYIFGRGYGHDVVNLNDSGNGKRDVVRLNDLNLDDVEFQVTVGSMANYHHVVLRIKETGETLTLQNAMHSTAYQKNYSLQAIEFADGSVMEWSELEASGLLKGLSEGTDSNNSLTAAQGVDTVFYGYGGNDTLTGGSGHDVLDGGAGNDILTGGGGNDVFVFGRGYGHDQVTLDDPAPGKRDVVRLLGLTRNEVVLYKLNSGSGATDLLIWIPDTNETLTVKNALSGLAGKSLEAIEFGDGTVLEWADFNWEALPLFDRLAMSGTEANETISTPADYLNVIIHGQGGNDTLNGGSGQDILHGDSGNDTLNGRAGDDALFGGEGDDKLNGEAGHDTLDGGAGNDALNGGAGNDVYVFGRGYGHDTANVYDTGSGKRDIVRLKDLNLNDIEFQVTMGNNTGFHNVVIIIKATGETLTLQNAMHSTSYQKNYSLQAIEFADGRVMEWAELEASGLLKGLSEGSAGNNSMTAALGVDTAFYGLAGNDSLTGGSGNDVLDGGAGDDTLFGGAGNDVYVFGKGYGNDRVNLSDEGPGKRDVVRLLGVGAAELTFFKKALPGSSSLYDVFIQINETGELLILERALGFGPAHSLQAIEFGDGSVVEWSDIDWNNIALFTGMPEIIGTAGNDNLRVSGQLDTILYGLDGNDTLTGGSGGDVLDGGAGDDSLSGGAGNDIYVFGRGYGHDCISSSDSDVAKRDAVRLVGLTLDEVEFLAVYESSTYQDVVIRIKDTGETLTIDKAVKNSADHNPYGVEAIEFGDGTVMDWSDFVQAGLLTMKGTEGDDSSLSAGKEDTIIYGYGGNDKLTGGAANDTLYGGAGNDTLKGKAGNDWLDGGAGNDSLEGGAGDDTYIFRAGDGQDSISNSGGGNDLLKFVDINPADLWFEKSGSHLLIGLVGADDRVTVTSWYSGDNKIDVIEAGSYAIAETQVAQMVQALAAVGAPGGAGGQWTEEQREALVPVLSAHWQPTV